MTDILTRMTQAAREERRKLYLGGNTEARWVRTTAGDFDQPHLFVGTYEECRAWIDRLAMLAALRVLAASEPTPKMVEAWRYASPSEMPDFSDALCAASDLRAMLTALIDGAGEP